MQRCLRLFLIAIAVVIAIEYRAISITMTATNAISITTTNAMTIAIPKKMGRGVKYQNRAGTPYAVSRPGFCFAALSDAVDQLALKMDRVTGVVLDWGLAPPVSKPQKS